MSNKHENLMILGSESAEKVLHHRTANILFTPASITERSSLVKNRTEIKGVVFRPRACSSRRKFYLLFDTAVLAALISTNSTFDRRAISLV